MNCPHCAFPRCVVAKRKGTMARYRCNSCGRLFDTKGGYKMNMRRETLESEPNFEMTVCFLDTETTGLSESAEIIELAIVDRNGVVLFEERFRPVNVSSWPDAQAIHGIYPEDVRDCPLISDRWDVIYAIVSKFDRVVIYNKSYDLPILSNSLNVAGVDINNYPLPDVKCAMLRFSDWFGEPSSRGGYRWQSLTTASASAGYSLRLGDIPHSARSDARATAHVWAFLDGVRARVIT